MTCNYSKTMAINYMSLSLSLRWQNTLYNMLQSKVLLESVAWYLSSLWKKFPVIISKHCCAFFLLHSFPFFYPISPSSIFSFMFICPSFFSSSFSLCFVSLSFPLYLSLFHTQGHILELRSPIHMAELKNPLSSISLMLFNVYFYYLSLLCLCPIFSFDLSSNSFFTWMNNC